MLHVMDGRFTDNESFPDLIDAHLNIGSFLRVFGIRVLQDDWDTIGLRNGQNAYLYYAPIEERIYLIPWDMDHTFGSQSAPIIPTTGSLRRLIGVPEYRRLFARLLEDMLDTFWTPEYVQEWTSAVNDEVGAAAGVGSPVPIVSFVSGRTARVDQVLRESLETVFEITTPSPFGVSEPSATVVGTAPLSAATFVIVESGEFRGVTPRWQSFSSSSVRIPFVWEVDIDGLAPGRNDLEIFAFDSDDQVVGSGEISIINTAFWDPPVVDEIQPRGGSVAGGIVARVLGQSFREPVQVHFGEVEAAVFAFVSSGEIRVTVPPAELSGPVDVVVTNFGGQEAILSPGFRYGVPAEGVFSRGDVNGDQRHNLGDALLIPRHLFAGKPLVCEDAADVNDDGVLDVVDVGNLLLYLFVTGSRPHYPFPFWGTDPTADALGCGQF